MCVYVCTHIFSKLSDMEVNFTVQALAISFISILLFMLHETGIIRVKSIYLFIYR